MSRPHPLCLFSEVASRLSSSDVASHDFYRNFCNASAVTVVIIGHLNRSFYLLTCLHHRLRRVRKSGSISSYIVGRGSLSHPNNRRAYGNHRPKVKVKVNVRTQTVTHPHTNRAQCRLTTLIEVNALTTTPRLHQTNDLKKLNLQKYFINIPNRFQKTLLLPNDIRLSRDYPNNRYITRETVVSGHYWKLFPLSLRYNALHFRRWANSIFGKIGRFASEEVVIQLFKSKCLPILLHCTEACKMSKSRPNLKSFDFAVNIFFVNLLKTSNADIVKYSQDQFGFKLPSELIPSRTAKFIAKLQGSDCV